ncbi:MAG: hypothetical protein LBS99_07385 [Clostridiales bacterium]|nr:hypothetical protein [Clostridiales bacterium]
MKKEKKNLSEYIAVIPAEKRSRKNIYEEMVENSYYKAKRDGIRLDLSKPYKILELKKPAGTVLPVIIALSSASFTFVAVALILIASGISGGLIGLCISLIFFGFFISIPVFVLIKEYIRGKKTTVQTRDTLAESILSHAYVTACDVDRFITNPKKGKSFFKASLSIAYRPNGAHALYREVKALRFKTDPGLYAGQCLGVCFFAGEQPIFLSECTATDGAAIAPQKTFEEARAASGEQTKIDAALIEQHKKKEFYRLDTGAKYAILDKPASRRGAILGIIPAGAAITVGLGLLLADITGTINQNGLIYLGLFFILGGGLLLAAMLATLLKAKFLTARLTALAHNGIVAYAYISGYERQHVGHGSENDSARTVRYYINYSYIVPDSTIVDRTYVGVYEEKGAEDRFLSARNEGSKIAVIFNEERSWILTEYTLIPLYGGGEAEASA